MTNNRGVTLTTNFLNPYDELRFRYKNNPLINQSDFDELIFNRSDEELATYLTSIDKYNDPVKINNLKNDYFFDEMSLDLKQLKMSLDLGYVDNSEKKKRTIVTGYSSDGNEILEEQELTDYEYYSKLINQYVYYKEEEKLLQLKASDKENKSTWTKAFNAVLYTFAEFGIGVFETVENILNFADATWDSLSELFNPVNDNKNNWKVAMSTFREQLSDDKAIGGLQEVTSKTRENLIEWARYNSYLVNVNGQYTSAGKIIGGIANSAGQMLPTMMLTIASGGTLAPLSQALFYTSIFESKTQERFRDPSLSSISTEFIIGESLLSTGIEFGVEFALGKCFGSTQSDLFRGVTGDGKLSTGFKRLISDAVQESTEEALQEFGSWLSSTVASWRHDEYKTDLSFTEICDAAVVGFFTSLITGGFAESRRTYNDYKASKSLASIDSNYYVLGDISKKGETKAQKEYRRNLLKTTRAQIQLEEIANQDDTPVFNNKLLNNTKTTLGNNGYGIGSVVKGYKNAVNGIDITTESGQKVVAQLTEQFYVGIKSILDLYGEFGEQRMIAAEQLLHDLDEYNNKEKLTPEERKQYAIKSSEIATKLSGQIRSLYKDKKTVDITKMIKSTVSDDEKEQVSEDDINRISSYLDMDDDELNELPDDERSIAKKTKELETCYDHYVVLWGINKIVEMDGVIFAKEEAIKNLPASEIVKSAAETTLVREYKNVIPADVLEHFVQMYNEYGGPLNADEDLNDVVITHLLFDINFYNYLLNRADIQSFNILKSIDNTLQKMIKNNSNLKMRQEYYAAVKRIKNIIGPALVVYLINNPYATLDNITVLTKEQIQYIDDKRVSHKLIQDVINNNNVDGKLNEKLNILKNRINNLPITKSHKEDLISRLDNVDTRKEAVEEINDELRLNWFGKYDDKTYPKDFTPNNARLTSFLQAYGITLDDLRRGRYDNLPEDAKNRINIYVRSEVQKYYAELFSMFTNGSYELRIDKNDVTVEPVHKETSEFSTEVMFKNKKRSKKYTNVVNSILVSDYLSDIVNISDIELTFTSLNDVLINPEKYLKKEVLDKIQAKYGHINSSTVAKFIKEKLGKQNLTIVLDTDGLYKFATFVTFEETVTQKYQELYNDKKTLLKKGKYKITDFIKNVPNQLKDIHVDVVRLGKDYDLGYFDKEKYIIVVNMDAIDSNKEFIDTIVHEYQHAIQQNYNINRGFTENFYLSDDFKNDIKSHSPDTYAKIEDIANKTGKSVDFLLHKLVYSNISGELDAEGLYEIYKDISPFYIIDRNNKTYIVSPWGKEYLVFYDIKSKRTKSLSLKERYQDAIDYKNNIDSALNLIKQNKDKNVKTYKKDLKQFKLPDDVIASLINGTYKKSTDKNLEQYNKVVSSYNRQQKKEKHKKHAEEGKKSLRGRALFEKNVKGTNLEYWLKKYPDKIPEVNSSVQEFVISATDFSKLDKWLVNKIKNADLTLRDIYNYVRDTDNMNDYTFQEIKKAFFKNTPFNSFNEVKSFVLIVEDAYALKAALSNIGAEHLIDKTIKWDLKDYKKNFDKMKSDKSLEKVVNDTLLRFNVYWETDSQGKKHKYDINMSDAKADIILGLLKYFDRSIDSLAYIAGNAKYAIQRSITNERPFTYTQKKDVSGHNTLSIDTTLKGKKDTESSHTLADVIEDERQRLEGNTDAENRAELIKFAKAYVSELISEGRTDEAISIGKTIAKNIKQMSDEEVETRLAIVNAMDNTGITFEEAFNIDLTNVVTAILDPDTIVEVGQKRSNVYNSVKGIVNRLAKNHINGKIYKNLPEEFKKYFNPSNGYRFNSDSVKGFTAQQLNDLKTSLQQLGERIRSGEFLSIKAKNAAENLRKENERLKKELERLKSGKQIDKETKKSYTIKISEEVEITSDSPVPEKLEKLLNTSFHKERESTKKFSRLDNARYLQVSMEEFYSQNAETFNELTETDILEILNFFETSTIINRDYVPYDALRVYILAYFVEQINNDVFDLDKDVLDRCTAMLDGIVSNTAARTLSVWRSVMPMVNPNKIILKELARTAGIELDDADVAPLANALKKLSHTKVVSNDPITFKKAVDEIRQTMDNLERLTIEKYRERIKKGESPLKLFGKEIKIKGKTIPKAGVRIIQERFLKFQKAAMLSAPATIVRNHLSNVILGGFTVKGKHIPGMNDIADWIGGSKLIDVISKSKKQDNQYDLRGVKVSSETANFVKKWLLDTGLLDIVSDGLSKYDPRTKNAQSGKIELQLQDMIIDSLTARVTGEHTFGKGKFTKWLEGKKHKIYKHGVTDNIVNFVFKMQSDTSAIKQSALRYIGKILESEKVDLSKGVDANVMSVIADAYAMASWEFMRRNNFISDFEQSWKRKHPNSYFMAKLIIPFASSSWNWFLETLQMTPIALINNIHKLNNLEKVINRLDEQRRTGDLNVPSSRFAEMIIRRNIGKGIIGTFLMLIGIGLGALGKINVDEEDDKLKLTVGDTWIDISNIFGTSSLLVGAAIAQPSKGNFTTVIENAFNQQFEDSIFTQFMNMFRYDETIWDYMSSLPTTIASTFVPNVWKSIVKLTNNHTVKYSDGILGNLQYFAVQTIPFMEYCLPKGIDPYTGEWEERYSVPALHQLANLIGSPISFKTYHKTDIELEFDALGISKKELKGEYDDVGKLDRDSLNAFYGKLNKQTLTDLINNKKKYKVQNEKGKYVELYYSDMSEEQKKNVLNRITTQNALYAKIFVWTNEGHKYYCSSNERIELSKIGITKNIYVGDKGFVP